MWDGIPGYPSACGIVPYAVSGRKGDVPACPVFVLAHFPDSGNAGRRQDGIHEPSVLEVLGEQAVMLDDLAHASVYEHVADGHQAAGTLMSSATR